MRVLYLTYWSLFDPLCQTQSVAYLRLLAERGHTFWLMTFEVDADKGMSQVERSTPPSVPEGIFWVPLPYHKGSGLGAKAIDFWAAVSAGIRLVRRHRLDLVHARGSIPGIMASVIARLSGCRFLFDADAPLSEEYVQTGHWRAGSRAARLTAWGEAFALRKADGLATLTRRRLDELTHQLARPIPSVVVPCCVDLTRFVDASRARDARRAQLGLTNETLLVYVGKAGPRYPASGVIGLYRAACETGQRVHLLVLTARDRAAFIAEAARQGLPSGSVSCFSAPFDDVPSWLAAADVAIAMVQPNPCERASSPIKVGEYLAAGLPVLIPAGIGDCSDLLEEARAGVVVSDFGVGAFSRAWEGMRGLLSDGDATRLRCLDLARTYASLHDVGGPAYGRIYDALANRCRWPAIW